MNEFDGVLAVHKPAGFTSHDVVAKVRRLVSMKRIGHTGTLDPAVTGVLPLCLGRSTRIVEYLQEMPKEYVATLRLGIATDTEDMTGTITEQIDSVDVSEEQVRHVLGQMIGTISQVPPMYSAIKVDGKRLYELAREGKTIERKAREVTIYELEIIDFKAGDHPEVSFRALCSKGTYIRTLCVDIGRALHVPSVMVELIRTQSAGISLDQCVTFEQIAEAVEQGVLEQHLIQPDQAMSNLPSYTVDASVYKHTLQGKRISIDAIKPHDGSQLLSTDETTDSPVFKLYAPDGIFIGIFRLEQSAQEIVPVKVFLP
ncbi:tRNA pseudouridine(55) synthase TruB [Paenibacillus sp. PsM32]|uniref:tRNA pseudouridine(55) synthase TruB n=1 Tax=Paenibacillus sp. PsM32 TaxID=3030536 RepID=UPI00263BD77A|nr:tRNA pseudouridine(55) synthase TruB [Paenibacillus sp. PsM32]MDN4616504.1 tRNA pseudouridine(55) synthase TruB [Paenibacillus sp. PsM32]